MKITSKNGTGLKLNFNTDAPSYYLNAIRRYIISEVPTLAIEDVELRKNEGILYDEMVAHRLGLIPIITDLKTYMGKTDVGCNFTLSVKGPRTVVSGELIGNDPKATPVYSEIPIAKLLKDQELELVAKAVLGTGKDHAKWSPGLAFYKEKSNGMEFNIESFGQLSPENMLLTAVDMFDKDLNRFEEDMKKLK